MALHADIVATDRIQTIRVDDILLRRVGYVLAAWTMAFFATDIPFGHLTRGEVVVNGMAAIAGGPGGAVGIGLAVVGRPPVGTIGDMVGQPSAVLDIPLRGERKVVASALFKVTLLPAAAVNERNL